MGIDLVGSEITTSMHRYLLAVATCIAYTDSGVLDAIGESSAICYGSGILAS